MYHQKITAKSNNDRKLSTTKKLHCTKMKFSIKDIFNKCDQIRSLLWIWSHLLKKSLLENFSFFAVTKPRRMLINFS